MQEEAKRSNSGQVAAQADFEFHKGIINATHNDFLIFLYEVLHLLLKRNYKDRWDSLLSRKSLKKCSADSCAIT